MPVLRIGEESNIGRDLGGLGQALSNALNPRTRAEALMLQQRMMLEQLQYQQELRKIQAQQAARAQWSHIVPPDKMPQIESMILQNAPYEQVARAAAQLSGNLIDATDPESTRRNIRYIEQLTGQPWKEAYAPVAGPLTQKARLDLETQQAGAKTGAETTGRLTAEDTRKKALLGQLTDSTDPAVMQKNLEIWRTAGMPEPAGGVVVAGPKTQALSRQMETSAEGAKAAATARGDVLGRGIQGTFLQPGGLPGLPPAETWTGAGPQTPETPRTPQTPAAPQTPAPATPAPAAPGAPAVGASVVPSAAAPSYAVPTTVTRTDPQGNVIVGGEGELSGALTKQRQEDLMAAYKQADPAMTLKSKLNEAEALVNFINAQGLGGQAKVAAYRALEELGLVVGDVGAARQKLQNIYTTELPEILKAAGVQRTAQPEIGAFRPAIGNPDMPPTVALGIIARQKAIADMQLQRAQNAGRVLYGYGGDMDFKDYVAADNQIRQNYDKTVQDAMSQYDTIYGRAKTAAAPAKPFAAPPTASTQTPPASGAQTPVVSPPTPAPAPTKPSEPAPAATPAPPVRAETPPASPEFPGGGVWGLVGRLFGGGGSAAEPVPAPAPAPVTPLPAAPVPVAPPPVAPAPRVFQMTPDGRLVMPDGSSR